MARPFLSVIIPARNEESRLPLTLVDVDRHLASQEFTYEILVVNDGSTDRTGEITARLAPFIARLKLLDTQGPHGMGYAVRTGMREAHGSWRLVMSAGNEVSAVEFIKLLPYLRGTERLDMIVGSRYVPGSHVRPKLPFLSRMLERTINHALRLILRVPVRDFSLGFLALSHDAAEAILPASRAKEGGVLPEVIVLGAKAGFKVQELPVSVMFESGPRLPLRRYLQLLWETITVRSRLIKTVAGINKKEHDAA